MLNVKRMSRIVAALPVLAFAVALAACGGTGDGGAQGGGTTTAQVETTINPSVSEELKQANTEAPNMNSKVDDLLGEWVDVNDETRFAKITQNGNEYQYEDNDGTYPATFDSGMMGVKVNETDIADVYYVSESGELVLDYKGEVTKFKRK